MAASGLGAAAGSVRPVVAPAGTGVPAKITSSLRLARSPRWSQVGSMVMPGESDRTTKPPTRGSGSSVLAQTTIQRRPTAPVEKIFRPVSDQPPGTRRAVVAGRPPRAGVPSSGSTRSALIRTGRALDSATASSYSSAGHVCCRACAACCIRVIALISATDGSPRPSACAMVTVWASPAPGPPWRSEMVAVSSPAACTASIPAAGKAPVRSLASAPGDQRRRHLGQAAQVKLLAAHAGRTGRRRAGGPRAPGRNPPPREPARTGSGGRR